MAKLNDAWGAEEELLHPRGKNGRWIDKAGVGMLTAVAKRILELLRRIDYRSFQSDQQASQYLFNNHRDWPELDRHRLMRDLGDTNAHLRAGEMDESTKKFVDMMDRQLQPSKDDLILHRTVGPEAFGISPEMMDAEDGGVWDLAGKAFADKGYSATRLGTPGTGKPIHIVIVAPKGTKIAPTRNGPNDRGVMLDRDVPIRVTKIQRDGKGGYHVAAVIDHEAERSEVRPLVSPGQATGRTPAQREAEVGRPRVLTPSERQVVAQDVQEQQRIAAHQQRQGEVLAPPPPGPTQTGPGGPPPRTEPVVTESVGGPSPRVAPVAAPRPEPIRAQDLREAVREANIESPSPGPRRRAFNGAYLDVLSGKKSPLDALRELETDINVAKRLRERIASGEERPDPELDNDIKHLESLADVIARNQGIERFHAFKPAGPPRKRATKSIRDIVDSRTKEWREGILARDKELSKVEGYPRSPVEERVHDYARAIKGQKVAPRPVKPERHPMARKPPVKGARVRKAAAPSAAPGAKPERLTTAQGRPTVQSMTPAERESIVRRHQQLSREFPTYPRNQDEEEIQSLAREIQGEPVPRKAAPTPQAAPSPAPVKRVAKAAKPAKEPGNLDQMTKEELLADPRAEGVPKSWTKDKIKAHIRGETPVPVKRAPAKKAAFSPHQAASRASEAAAGPAGPQRLANIDATLQGLNDTQLRSVAREIGLKLPPKSGTGPKLGTDTVDGLRLFIARNLDSFLITTRRGRLGTEEPRDLDQMTKAELLADPRAEGARQSWTKARILEHIRGGGIAAPVKAAKKAIPATPRASAPDLTGEHGLSTVPAVREVQVENRIRAAYRDIRGDRGYGNSAWVGMADLREQIGDDIPRSEVDAALRRMLRAAPADPNEPGAVRLIPVANRKALKPRDRAAQFRIGDDDIDALAMDDPSPRLLPVGAAPRKAPTPEPAKAVTPEPVVHNPVAQRTLSTPDRINSFADAWDKAFPDFVPTTPAQRSIEEVARDVGTGQITPDEGIRRLETDIDFNRREVSDLRRRMRGASPSERSRLSKEAADLERDIRHQEHASDTLRRHFRDEPEVTPDEVKVALADSPEARTLGERMREMSPADVKDLKQQLKNQGYGDIQGDTGEEVFDNALKKIIKDELTRREAKKAAKVAPAPKAPDKPKPNLEGSRYQRLDARAIAEGLDLRSEHDVRMLDSIQEMLDGKGPLGKDPTPARIGRYLETWNDGPAGPGGEASIMRAVGTRSEEHQAEIDRRGAELDRRHAEWKKLADRLMNTRRQRAREAVPETKPTVTRDEKKDIARTAEITGIPQENLEKAALRKKEAEAPPKPSAQQVADSLHGVGSYEEARHLLQGRTKAELLDVLKVQGVSSPRKGPRATKTDIIDDIVMLEAVRSNWNAIRNDARSGIPEPGVRRYDIPGAGSLTRQELMDSDLGTLTQIENDLGIKRESLLKEDRVNAIIGKVGGPGGGGDGGEVQVRAAYDRLKKREGDWVPLADLRDDPEFKGLSRQEQDNLLRRMAIQPGVHIIPDDNTKALTQRDRDASVQIGGAPTHLIRFDPGGGGTKKAIPAATPEVSAVDENVALSRDPEGNNMRMHGDSLTMGLAQAYAAANRNGSANRMMDLRRRATTEGPDGISPQQVVDELRALRAQETDPNFQRRIDRAIEGIDSPMTPLPELPPNTPPLARKLIEDLHAIPYARKGDRAPSGGGSVHGPSLVDQLAEVYRDVVAGRRGEEGRRPEDRIRSILRDKTHEVNEASFRIWSLAPLLDSEGGKPSPLAAELRQWERGGLPSVSPAGTSLEGRTVAELHQIATAKGIPVPANASRAELLQAIRDLQK